MSLLPASYRPVVQLLKHRNYAYYACGSFTAAAGLWMQRVAVGWLTWEMTQSGFWLGAVALADLFPSIVVGPIGGAMADRFDRLKLTRLMQALSGAQAVVLLILLLSGLLNIWLLFALVLFLGTVQALGFSVQLSLVPSLIPREMIPSAVAFNSVAFASARFVGPAIGGIVITSGGVAAAVAVNAVTFAIYVALLFQIVPLRPEMGRGGERLGLFRDVAAGVRYAARHEGIAAMLILLMALSFGTRAVTEVLPKFTAVIFGGDAGSFATLLATMGGGAVIGGIWMSSRTAAAGLSRLALHQTLMQAVALLVLPFSGSVTVAAAIMAVLGFGMSTSFIAKQTLIQLAVDDTMRGRVMSLYGMIFRGAPGVGALIIGLASDFVGIPLSVVAAGVAMAAVVLWIALRRDRIAASLETRHRPAEGV